MTISYYLVGIGTGHVLAKNTKEKSGRIVLENKGEEDDEQKWTVEFGDEPDLVALKCVADGKYMNSPEIGVKDNAGVTLGDDKQWWKVTNDNLTPNVACRFNVASSPGQFIYTHGSVLEKGQHHTAHMRDWTASVSMVCFHGLPLIRWFVAKLAERLWLLLRRHLDRLRTSSSDARYLRYSQGEARCFKH
jgi:hypothetical protein